MSADTTQTTALRSVIEDFLDELASTVSDPRKVERVLAEDEILTINDLSNQPEEWTEDNLIWPLIETVGLNRKPGRPASQRSAAGTTQREAPDFRLVEQGGEFVVIDLTGVLLIGRLDKSTLRDCPPEVVAATGVNQWLENCRASNEGFDREKFSDWVEETNDALCSFQTELDDFMQGNGIETRLEEILTTET